MLLKRRDTLRHVSWKFCWMGCFMLISSWMGKFERRTDYGALKTSGFCWMGKFGLKFWWMGNFSLDTLLDGIFGFQADFSTPEFLFDHFPWGTGCFRLAQKTDFAEGGRVCLVSGPRPVRLIRVMRRGVDFRNAHCIVLLLSLGR